jgi:hypothetical protein
MFASPAGARIGNVAVSWLEEKLLGVIDVGTPPPGEVYSTTVEAVNAVPLMFTVGELKTGALFGVTDEIESVGAQDVISKRFIAGPVVCAKRGVPAACPKGDVV